MSDQSAKIAILKKWRKNYGIPVVDPFVPIKLTDKVPQRVHK